MSVCTSPVKTGRNPAIDVAKGIGILLVVFAHINYTPAPLTYIYSFHMPLFFILSGLLFRKEKYPTFRQFLKNRFYTLICPYLFFYSAALVIKILTTFASDGISGVLSPTMLKALTQMFLAWGPSASPNNPLWFVPCLLCVEIMYFFIVSKKPWVNGLICTVLVCLGWLMKSEYLHIAGQRLLWNADIAFFAIGYYAFGNLFAEKLTALQENFGNRKLICLAAALLLGVILYPLAMYNGKVSVGSGIFQNGFLLYATGIIGTAGVLFAAFALENCRFLQYLGKNTFAIMGTHYVIRNLMNIVFKLIGFGGYDRENLVQSIRPFFFVLAASIVCTEIYNRMKTNILSKKGTHL